jgi:undecaprenyl diphosphate synthase
MRFLELLERRARGTVEATSAGAIGRPGDLPDRVQATLAETIDFLKGGGGLLLNLAISYGGRAEIVDAVKKIVAETRERARGPRDVDERLFESHLYTAGLPDPDLLIRTSGELRISNFLLWQLAYSEIWVTDTLWPDFRKKHLFEAVRDYQKRDRRFGKVD